MRETWVWSLGGEESLEESMGTHSSNLAWRNPWTEEPGGLPSLGSQRVRHDWETNIHMDTHKKKYVSDPEYLTCTLRIKLKILIFKIYISSVQSLSHVRLFATHESQHARPPCPSPTPGVHSNSRPSSPWCHPAISSSVVPFSSFSQSLSASESFQWVNS